MLAQKGDRRQGNVCRCRRHQRDLQIGETPPQYDRHLPLMSVPLVLGLPPDPEPAEVPYLGADPSRVVWVFNWASRLRG